MYITYPNNKAYSDVVLIQVYSNGMSEVYLGRAIKKFNLPRDELVIMTKVLPPTRRNACDADVPLHSSTVLL